MVLSISNLAEPIGSMKHWLPPITGVAGATIPAGWLICDGSTVADAASSYNGIALPDTRNSFRRNHSTMTNANFPTNNVYKAGGTIPSGGVDSNSLNHSHAYGFNINHTHNGPSHTHGVNNDTHNHGIDNVSTGSNVTTFNPVTPNGPVQTFNHTHSHGGSTQSSGSGTTGSMNSNDQQNGSVNGALGVTENRPVFQEYVTIIKIK
jgi:hypothetical protein